MASTFSFVRASQTTWFIQLRWLAASVGMLVVLVGWLYFNAFTHPIALVLALLGLVALNLGYSWFQERLGLSSGYSFETQKRTNNLLRVQIAGDLVVLFSLLLFSGGLQNPLVYLFLLHVAIASILFSSKESWKYVLTISVFPWVLFVLAWGGWTPTQLNFLDTHFSVVDEACRLLVFFIMAGGLWLIVSRISDNLRSAERQVRESGEVLTKTKMDLTLMESHRNKLLGNLAKELNQPIQHIADHFEELDKDIRDGAGTKAWTALRSFQHELSGLKDIASDLEWLADPHWSQMKYQKERVDIMGLAAKEIARQEVLALEKTLKFKLIGPKKLVLNADRRALQQIFSQLLSNAVKYTPSGQGDIFITVERQVPYALFSVTDHGVGIPEAEKNNLFQEFYRSSNVESTHTSGSGLGLYIIKQIVDWHRGMIKVESHLGAGTTFKVWLPLDTNEE